MLSKRMNRSHGRFAHIFILLLIGLFVSAQQVSSESVFDRKSDLALSESKLGAPAFGPSHPAAFYSAAADTVEIYDIDIYEEEDRNIYKEVAVYAIVVAAVGYFVYTLIKPDDEAAADDGGGKEPPITPSISLSFPLSR